MKGKMVLVVIVTSLIFASLPVVTGDWNRTVRLTYSGSADNQVLLVDQQDDIHLIFQDSPGAYTILKYLKLDRTGSLLIPQKVLISGNHDAMYPAASLDERGIHLVWWDSRDGNYRLFYTHLDHNGTRQGPDYPIGNEIGNDQPPSEAPRISLDDLGNICIVWSQNDQDLNDVDDVERPNPSVYFMKIDIGGSILIPAMRISTGYTNGIHPDIIVDDQGEVHIVWSEDLTGNYEVYYTKISDQNSPDQLDIIRLSDTPMESIMSRLLYHYGKLYITWSDGEETGEIQTVHFGRIKGSNLLFDIQISRFGNALYPSIASRDSSIFIMWQDDRHSLEGAEGRDAYEGIKDNLTSIRTHLLRHVQGEQGFDSGDALTNWEVYYSVLDENGMILENNTRLTTEKRASMSPEIVMDSNGSPHVVWVDMAQSSGDLYYIDGTEKESTESQYLIDPKENSIILVGGIGLLFLFYMLSSESRRYPFMRFILVPLYSTLSREKLMENDNRRQIVALISSNEGITFTSLMDELGLKNGALAYHLYTLERQRYIKSVKDGKYRRFYPKGARITGLSSLEERIFNVIEANPSISQREIATKIESTPQTVNYNIKKLIKKGVIILRKEGKHTRCFLTDHGSGNGWP